MTDDPMQRRHGRRDRAASPLVPLTRMAVLALALGSSACQVMPEDTMSAPVEIVSAPIEVVSAPGPLPDASPPRERRVARPELVLEELPVVEPADLLARLRRGFVLPGSEDRTVQRELAWFAAHQDYLDRVFLRGERYLYHIAETIAERDMPLDLALLPVVESAFDPFAYSHGRASGLWQIIPGTGRRLDLKQNWWFDARRDVIESTRAALDYLEQLHEQFDGDWLLAVAGYNSGEGNVARALRRAAAAGERTDFWGIRRYLPVETRTYVPRLLALRELVAAPLEHGVSLPILSDEPYFAVVETRGQIDMTLAAELADIELGDLYALNPGINRWATDPEGPHRLVVPVDRSESFAAALEALGEREQVQWTRHRIRPGETLSHLALEYHTTEQVLRDINDLGGNTIRAGDYLMIPHAQSAMNDYTHSLDARQARQLGRARDGRRQLHVVAAGESLWTISRRYRVGVRELAGWNAMAPGDVLSVGRKLVIWTDAPVAVTQVTSQIRRINYVVRRGDSLYSIASRFRVTVNKLLEWNSISSNKYLQPGQRLVMYVDVTEQSI